MFLKLVHKIEKEEMLLNLFHKINIYLDTKTRQGHRNKRKLYNNFPDEHR
jgi:hypothetical protein